MDESKRNNLMESTGLPIQIAETACDLVLGDQLNEPEYTVRKIHDLDKVWANPVDEEDRVLYKVTSGLWLQGDEAIWSAANIIYGIVVFSSGTVGGEYIKSSGQYHPIRSEGSMATPEIYTVLKGIGHFLLQKAAPPYEIIEDVILVEVHEGETFVVPPDYGHLQINPGNELLVFAYTVMDGMAGVYEPFRKKRGAIYYEMAIGQEKYVFNSNYSTKIPLHIIKAGEICQLPFLNEEVTYQKIRDNISQLRFLTEPSKFPTYAML